MLDPWPPGARTRGEGRGGGGRRGAGTHRGGDDQESTGVEYGLIAEQVSEATPELVIRDAKGEPFTVRYQTLSTLLLNEWKSQQGALQQLVAENDALRRRVSAMEADSARIGSLAARLGQLLARRPAEPIETASVR